MVFSATFLFTNASRYPLPTGAPGPFFGSPGVGDHGDRGDRGDHGDRVSYAQWAIGCRRCVRIVRLIITLRLVSWESCS